MGLFKLSFIYMYTIQIDFHYILKSKKLINLKFNKVLPLYFNHFNHAIRRDLKILKIVGP